MISQRCLSLLLTSLAASTSVWAAPSVTVQAFSATEENQERRAQNEVGDFHKDVGMTSNLDSEDPAIKGGVVITDPLKYPFFAALEREGGGSQFCGGSIIHDDILLTAAHCDVDVDEIARMLSVQIESGGITRSVTGVMNHPSFTDDTVDGFDYAVVKLDSSALVDSTNANTGVTLVTMNQDAAVPAAGAEVVVMGYGLQNAGVDTLVFREATARAVSDAECSNSDPTINCITHSDMAVCSGDSGGPVIDVATGRNIGLVSFGPDCEPGSTGEDELADVQEGYAWILEQACSMTSIQTGLCAAPTNPPTKSPTRSPTSTPTRSPTRTPTRAPTRTPTKSPTRAPTNPPTGAPTPAPIAPAPTSSPTVFNYKYETIITYFFPVELTRPPTAIETSGVIGVTEVFFRRIIASLFPVSYEQVEVTLEAASVVVGTESVQYTYETTVFFRLDSTIPSEEEVQQVLAGASVNDYIDRFVHFASPRELFTLVSRVELQVMTPQP